MKDIDNTDAWLYTLAHNHLTDHYRKLATEKKYHQTVLHHMERQSNVVLLDIYKKELEHGIESLLEFLSPRQKKVYILSLREGLSLEEIASYLKF
ncbi:MAG TPA: sigma factor-like helix-turn-helix DNA-binding protein [Membranihabitans sp.]|nr:sigma factor-like helix-turn-helix DNA-binding protein [Membranihabitans sp.]